MPVIFNGPMLSRILHTPDEVEPEEILEHASDDTPLEAAIPDPPRRRGRPRKVTSDSAADR